MYTTGEPVAGSGMESSLLGTIARRNGPTQATYAGKPLYYYAHDRPDEVRCHNVDLNGGGPSPITWKSIRVSPLRA